MINELWPGGPLFKESEGMFRLCTDSILLAHFAKSSRVNKRKRAVDLGCGSGIISILLAYDDPDLHVDGVEIQPDAALLASENTMLSGLCGRVTIHEGDLRRHNGFLPTGNYDLAVANPPYYVKGCGKRPESAGLAAARSEEFCTFEDICKTARSLTRWGGSFALVHKPERLTVIFSTLSDNGFEPKRIRFVQHGKSSPPCLVLIESRRGGKPSLTVEAPLMLTNDDGSDSDEVNLIYRRNEVVRND